MANEYIKSTCWLNTIRYGINLRLLVGVVTDDFKYNKKRDLNEREVRKLMLALK